MFLLISIISLFYIILIALIILGWDRVKPFDDDYSNSDFVFISVVIAFRNEEKKINLIIEDILNQEFEKNKFELILVNDHSNDKSNFIAENYLGENINIKLFQLAEREGKKYALDYGIKHAKGEIIITTDADCRVGENWLKTIGDFYLQTKAKMIVCPVLYKTTRKSFSFKNFQALEFLSLTASTAGSLGINKPIMCNGANLAFEKKVYLKFSNPTNIKYLSGDDVFLLFNVLKKYAHGIKYLKSNEATVHTEASETIIDFFNQRIRWASKTKHYTNFFVLVSGIITLLMNIIILISFLLMLLNIFNLWYFFIPFILKFIIDLFLLSKTSKYFRQTKLLLLYFPLQIIYPLYVSIIGVASFFYKYNWKGRKEK